MPLEFGCRAGDVGEGFSPSVGQLEEVRRRLGGFQESQSVSENRELKLSVKWLADWMAKGEIQKDGARWTDALDDVKHEADVDGRQSPGFERSGDQSDGLMVARSARYKENRIHRVLSHPSGQVIGHLCLQPLGCRRIPPPADAHGVGHRR